MHAHRRVVVAIAFVAVSMAAGCCADEPRSGLPVVHGRIADTAEFERFLATHPAPDEFRAHYPDVTLVLPGEMATKELRLDRSRYFARLDGDGRVIGGKFQ